MVDAAVMLIELAVRVIAEPMPSSLGEESSDMKAGVKVEDEGPPMLRSTMKDGVKSRTAGDETTGGTTGVAGAGVGLTARGLKKEVAGSRVWGCGAGAGVGVPKEEGAENEGREAEELGKEKAAAGWVGWLGWAAGADCWKSENPVSPFPAVKEPKSPKSPNSEGAPFVDMAPNCCVDCAGKFCCGCAKDCCCCCCCCCCGN